MNGSDIISLVVKEQMWRDAHDVPRNALRCLFLSRDAWAAVQNQVCCSVAAMVVGPPMLMGWPVIVDEDVIGVAMRFQPSRRELNAEQLMGRAA